MRKKGVIFMKTVVVTGATSGIGLSVCRALAALGYGIIGVGRREEACLGAVETLRRESPGVPAVYFCGDLSKQSEVLRVGNEMKEYIEDKC